MTTNDEILIRFVQQEINAGKKKIAIPEYLLRGLSDEVICEIRQLCKLNGVNIEIRR